MKSITSTSEDVELRKIRRSSISVIFPVVVATSKLLLLLEERSAKGIFLGIYPAGYKVLNLQSKVAYVPRTVKVFDGREFPFLHVVVVDTRC